MTTRPLPPPPPQAQDGFGLGVAGIYHGGVKWAIKRNEYQAIGEPDYYMDMPNETEARKWFAGYLEGAKRNMPDEPELWPELVAARITWQVQT